MGRRADAIVTACAILSLAMFLASPVIALSGSGGWACLLSSGACYLVMLAVFVLVYGRGDG